MGVLQQLLAAYKPPPSGGGGTPIPFADNFNDGVIDPTKWTVNQIGGHVATESGGQLVMTPAANTVGAVDMRSPVMDFNDKSVEFTIGQVVGGDPFQAGYNYTQFRVQKDASNFIYFGLSGSHPFRDCYFEVYTGGVGDGISLGASGWGLLGTPLRFSLAGTTATFSQWNGSVFVPHTSRNVSWDASAVQFLMISGYWGTGNSSIQPATYDDVISDAEYIP